jgi:hypothetical protein
MHWGRLPQLFNYLKRRLRWERRTAGDSRHLQELSESIVEYGRMIQAHTGYGGTDVVVEVAEMAHRFRETPKTIKKALAVLGEAGWAQPIHLRGCWRLQLTRTGFGDAERFPSYLYPHLDDKNDRGAA